MGHETPTVLANKIVDIMKNDSNLMDYFYIQLQGKDSIYVLQVVSPMATGQLATVGIYEELERQGNFV